MITRYRLFIAVPVYFAAVFGFAQPAEPLVVKITPIVSPAGHGAMGSSVVTSAQGDTWLSWVEPLGENEHVLKVARFDPDKRSWGMVRTVAHGANWFLNWADFPVLAVDGDRLTAVWFVDTPAKPTGGHHSSYYAQYAISENAGITWSRARPVTMESQAVEFVALQPLPGGRILAAWLDGRSHHANGQALYARILGEAGPDALIDSLVCDCCQLSLTALADGSVVIAYRGRTKEEVRDMRFARFAGSKWGEPQVLHPDGWKINACPVNGPQLAAQGKTLGVAWYTAAQDNPRVLAARALDGGMFGPPTQINEGRALGRVDSAILADGRLLVTWLEAGTKEQQGGIFLRAVGPDGQTSPSVKLASAATARASGFPRISLRYDGGLQSLVVTCTTPGDQSQVVTFLVTF